MLQQFKNTVAQKQTNSSIYMDCEENKVLQHGEPDENAVDISRNKVQSYIVQFCNNIVQRCRV